MGKAVDTQRQGEEREQRNDAHDEQQHRDKSRAQPGTTWCFW